MNQMAESVVQKHEEKKENVEETKAKELAKKKKEEEKKAIEEARNELLAPEKVFDDSVALQTSNMETGKNPIVDAKMAEIIAENNESITGKTEAATTEDSSTQLSITASTESEEKVVKKTEA